MRTSMLRRQSAHRQQRGQALVEGLVAALALAVLWVSLNWMGQYQDMAMSAVHASRHAAFLASRYEVQALAQNDAAVSQVRRYFTGNAHRWTDRRGAARLNPETGLHPSWSRGRALPAEAQPGGSAAHASVLRRDWGLEETGVVHAQVRVEFEAPRGPADDHLRPLGTDLRDRAYPGLRRSAYILAGAGHAASDTSVQASLSQSRLAWASAYGASRSIGAAVASRASPVDAGWDRPAPDLDWLQPWSGRVPGHLTENYEGQHNEHTFPYR